MDDAALDRIEKAIGPNMHINRYFSIRKTDQEDRDALAQLRREHAELTAEVNRLNTLHTLTACANNCGRGVRSRHAVHGMCPACAEAEIDRLKDKFARFLDGYQREGNEICQDLGKALGCMWYKDDQVNFPGATEADGVFVGEDVAASMAAMAAKEITRLDAEVKRLNNTLDAIRSVIRSTVESMGNGHLLPEELVREAGK